LLTLVERKSKLTKISKLRRSTARATQGQLCVASSLSTTSCTPSRSTTKGIAAHQDIAHALKQESSSQHRTCMERGLNENTNGLIRDFFPKGQISLRSLMPSCKVERLLNARPRKSLGFRSPQSFWTPSLPLKFLCTGELNPRMKRKPAFQVSLLGEHLRRHFSSLPSCDRMRAIRLEIFKRTKN